MCVESYLQGYIYKDAKVCVLFMLLRHKQFNFANDYANCYVIPVYI